MLMYRNAWLSSTISGYSMPSWGSRAKGALLGLMLLSQVLSNCFAGSTGLEPPLRRGIRICGVEDLAVLCETTDASEKRLWVIWSADMAYLMQIFGPTPQVPINGKLSHIDFVEETCRETERELNWPGVMASIAGAERLDGSVIIPPDRDTVRFVIEDCNDQQYSSATYPLDDGSEHLPADTALKLAGFVRWLAEPK